MIRHFALLIALALATAQAAGSTGYDAEPLKVRPLDYARVVVESVAINNWLNANHKNMSAGQVQGAREHLHALIDAQVKESYANSASLIPKEPDPILAMLYSWAGRLGVFGADAIYETVKGKLPITPPPGPQPPLGFDVALHGESLRISPPGGRWQVEVPYHLAVSSPKRNTRFNELRMKACESWPRSARTPPAGYASCV